jgi:hypothetical protein
MRKAGIVNAEVRSICTAGRKIKKPSLRAKAF